MSQSWQLQEAKARLSELVKRARTVGPQVVTLRGVEAAVVLSVEDYRRLKAGQPNFRDFLLAMPPLDDAAVEFINQRSRDVGRDIDL